MPTTLASLPPEVISEITEWFQLVSAKRSVAEVLVTERQAFRQIHGPDLPYPPRLAEVDEDDPHHHQHVHHPLGAGHHHHHHHHHHHGPANGAAGPPGGAGGNVEAAAGQAFQDMLTNLFAGLTGGDPFPANGNAAPGPVPVTQPPAAANGTNGNPVPATRQSFLLCLLFTS